MIKLFSSRPLIPSEDGTHTGCEPLTNTPPTSTAGSQHSLERSPISGRINDSGTHTNGLIELLRSWRQRREDPDRMSPICFGPCAEGGELYTSHAG